MKANPDAFDVLISDYNMPDMTGIALIHEAKRFNPVVKGILCSSAGSAEEERVKVGDADGFLGKPGSPQTLARIVRNVLDRQVTAVDR